MQFGLSGSAAARRPTGSRGRRSTAPRGSATLSNTMSRPRGGLHVHLCRRASFHRLWTGLGDAEPADPARRPHQLPCGSALRSSCCRGITPILLAEQARLRRSTSFLGHGRFRHRQRLSLQRISAGSASDMDDAGARFDECLSRYILKAWTPERARSLIAASTGRSTISSSSRRRRRAARIRRSGWARRRRKLGPPGSRKRGSTTLLGPQYAQPADVAKSIAAYPRAGDQGRCFDLGGGRRHLRLFCLRQGRGQGGGARPPACRTWRVKPEFRWLLAGRHQAHGGLDCATGDPDKINRGKSDVYGTLDEIAEKLDELRVAGAGYVLINGGGSGGGQRGWLHATLCPRDHAELCPRDASRRRIEGDTR